MAKIINIVNGTGTGELINDTYSITANVTGYDNASILPSSITVEEDTNNYALTIAATGTLTLHVSEDGTSDGTPVSGAVFIRTDSLGNEYGTEITSNAEGNAVFNNVPFDANNAPLIYFKQTASDGEHEFSTAVQSTSLTNNTGTFEIENAPGAVRTITLTDANYSNLPIDSGSVTFTN